MHLLGLMYLFGRKGELINVLKDIKDNVDIDETIQGIKGLIKPLDFNNVLLLLSLVELIQRMQLLYHTYKKDMRVISVRHQINKII